MDEFEKLLASSKIPLERWLKAHIGHCADAEDVMQETCLAAFQGFSGLQNKAAFLPWILGIAFFYEIRYHLPVRIGRQLLVITYKDVSVAKPHRHKAFCQVCLGGLVDDNRIEMHAPYIAIHANTDTGS